MIKKKEVKMNKIAVGEEREVNVHLSYDLLSLIFARASVKLL